MMAYTFSRGLDMIECVSFKINQRYFFNGKRIHSSI